MRNLAEYPITTEEIVACLNKKAAEALADDQTKGVYGNMDAALLQEAVKIITEKQTSVSTASSGAGRQ